MSFINMIYFFHVKSSKDFAKCERATMKVNYKEDVNHTPFGMFGLMKKMVLSFSAFLEKTNKQSSNI